MAIEGLNATLSNILPVNIRWCEFKGAPMLLAFLLKLCGASSANLVSGYQWPANSPRSYDTHSPAMCSHVTSWVWHAIPLNSYHLSVTFV
jgi:hypothetical protein